MDRGKPASYYFIQYGFYLLVLVLLAGIAFSFKAIFPVLFASIVLALLLEPLVNYFETKGINRVLVILMIYVLIAGSLAVLLSFLVPLFVFEVKNLLGNLPSYGAMVQEQLEKINSLVKTRFPGAHVPDFYLLLKEKIFTQLQVVMASVPAFASGVFSLVTMLFVVPFIAFFILADGYLILKVVLHAVPNRYFEMAVLLLHRIVEALKLYVRGQLIDSCSIMAMSTVGYAIIGLPYFIEIGLIAGIANFIPYFGSIISVCVALFVLLITPGAFTLWSFLGVAGVFAAVQIIDGTLVYPNVVGRSVNLHPLAVIAGILAGGSVGGIVGMLIAVPLISICKVTIEVLYTYLKSYSII
jgi:predicted PurR-regulated permease PerM